MGVQMRIKTFLTDLRNKDIHDLDVNNFITEITYQDLVVIKMEHSIVQPSFSISDRYQPDIVTIITYDKNIKKGTNNESK